LNIQFTDLDDVSGLENLNYVDVILIMNNPSLLNLDGFSGINSELTALFIVENNSLNDITGVSNIAMNNNPVGVDISNNPNLSFCSLPNLCNV